MAMRRPRARRLLAWQGQSSWPSRPWDITKHYQFIGGDGAYGVGNGAPTSAGAALAHRDAGRIPISLQADGDLMILPGALWTMAHHRIPLLSVVHNNRAWHQETMHLTRIANPDQLRPALSRALDVVKAGKPALVDVVSQPR